VKAEEAQEKAPGSIQKAVKEGRRTVSCWDELKVLREARWPR